MKPRFSSVWKSKDLRGWLLVAPALLIFITFYVGPAFLGLRISLFKWDGIADMQFVGFENYIRLFSTARFWNDVRVNLIVLVVSLVTIIPGALMVAVSLSRRGLGMTFFRNAIFLPQVLSIAAIALIWTLMYDPFSGLINYSLKFIGLDELQTPWLGNNSTVLWSVILSILWASLGFHVVLFMAGLSGIPSEYYDAAKLETSSFFHTLRYITIPLLRETIFMSFVVIVGSSFGSSTGLVFLLTAGGPGNRTELLGLYGYSIAFRGRQFGYSSAISLVILILVIALVIGPAFRLAKERLEY
ncbi:MAG: carbohydrate ABC transporter permease [Chloroflexota bacterium]